MRATGWVEVGAFLFFAALRWKRSRPGSPRVRLSLSAGGPVSLAPDPDPGYVVAALVFVVLCFISLHMGV
jgi:hypothetical protein